MKFGQPFLKLVSFPKKLLTIPLSQVFPEVFLTLMLLWPMWHYPVWDRTSHCPSTSLSPQGSGLPHREKYMLYFSQCHRIRLGPKIAKVVTEIHLDRSKLSQQRGVMWIYHIPLQALFKILRPTKQPRIRNISRLVIEGFSASGKAAYHSVIQSPWLKLVIPTLLKKLILILPLLRASRTKIAISLAFRAHHPIYFHK